jgi:CubicO group peptidase (beta-lactamase class C family)
MPHLDDISAWITEKLPALLAEHKVPGAAVGVYAAGEVFDFASGVLSHATGVEATADSVSQIGSITKTWTATLVMQLADEGLLDLDAAVARYLPDFRLADGDAASTLTVRQLLCHTAGFEGDIFTDTGWNDDCVQRYVETLAAAPQLFPPGEMFSYNNAGYCVLGRVIEVPREKPFDQALRDAAPRPEKPGQPTAEVAVRRALTGAVQLTQLGQVLTSGAGKPATGLVAPALSACKGNTVGSSLPGYSASAAKSALAGQSLSLKNVDLVPFVDSAVTDYARGATFWLSQGSIMPATVRMLG